MGWTNALTGKDSQTVVFVTSNDHFFYLKACCKLNSCTYEFLQKQDGKAWYKIKASYSTNIRSFKNDFYQKWNSGITWKQKIENL